MAKSKLDKWTEELDALNTERAEAVYKLSEKAGNDPGDWASMRRLETTPHPTLDDLSARIAEHVAQRPQED